MSSHTRQELTACQQALKSVPSSPMLQGAAGPAAIEGGKKFLDALALALRVS